MKDKNLPENITSLQIKKEGLPGMEPFTDDLKSLKNVVANVMNPHELFNQFTADIIKTKSVFVR